MGYKPSPRPSFDVPTAVRAADAVRHTWGDEDAGFVDDWIYVSSDRIHAIVFGLPILAVFGALICGAMMIGMVWMMLSMVSKGRH